jgi:hypothetical protein
MEVSHTTQVARYRLHATEGLHDMLTRILLTKAKSTFTYEARRAGVDILAPFFGKLEAGYARTDGIFSGRVVLPYVHPPINADGQCRRPRRSSHRHAADRTFTIRRPSAPAKLLGPELAAIKKKKKGSSPAVACRATCRIQIGKGNFDLIATAGKRAAAP